MSFPTSLQDYYATNYTRCSELFSIFSTSEFLSFGAKSQFFVLVPINLFGFYCILFKTPKYMSEFQFHLCHLQFWFTVLTIFYTILTTPYHFFPASVRCSVGLFRDMNISSTYQLLLINIVTGGIVSAVILLFENRHKHLVPPTDIFYKINGVHRLILGIFNFLLGSLGAWTIFLQDGNQELVKMEYLKLVPCPTKLYFDECSVAIPSAKNIWALGVGPAGCLIPIQVIFFISHSLMYLRKIQNINTFSKRTKKLQKSFFRAGIAQVTSPILVIVVPLFLLTYILITKQYLPGAMNICILCIPSHSALSTGSLILFNVPYRDFVRHKFKITANSVQRNSRVAIVSS
ncbi:Serpentine Receptor, class H [Caenorhabditis elegans]|uniref:Serpentine Receptor, class H n=1 Tax=Caenorhabditis elegans TaxID=6239 RepID=P91030_CAEEL|nr:Serpentine Receptor, class H [Caenorhabditis elegans]CCD64180.1 Serpentine Receptor, class H [Caenorhabditis elegans]|eukprot:NP_491816.1 Serpentine Receptor, class H [Caenorhabditis elegans]